MYKIYINENKLTLADSTEVNGRKSTNGILLAPYSGKIKMLFSYIDMLEKTDRFDEIIIYAKDSKALLKDFESLYKVIKASGGLVLDETDKMLLIHRRGFWDLPKGKIEKGEKKKAAAIREVEEETGISDIVLHNKILTTRHTYRLKGVRVLKKSYWYYMSAPNQKLVPQTEEDIEQAHWVSMNQFMDLEGPIYQNINDVIEHFKHQREQLLY